MSAPQVVRDSNGHVIIVTRTGRRYTHGVALYNPPVRLVKVPLEYFSERRRRYVPEVLVPLTYKGKPYPLARALRLFRQAGRALGITGGAKAALETMREAA